MSESLIIQLRVGESPRWMVCNDDGQVVVNAIAGELEQAAPLSTGRRVAVIVPASDVLSLDTEVPAKSAAKLAQVVPFALEERVADEVENLHFALGERSAETGKVNVLVVERARMDAWLNALRAAGLAPQAIYSEASLMPAMPGQLIALLEGDSLTLRHADGPPLVMPALAIPDAFELALATQASPVAGLEPLPVGLLLYAGHDEWAAH
jgi:general secretion pathway protein L